MKLEIYDEALEKPVARLRLMQEPHNGRITLYVVDKDGDMLDGGTLLTICHNGEVRSFSGVNKEFGLNLDEEDRIIFNEGL